MSGIHNTGINIHAILNPDNEQNHANINHAEGMDLGQNPISVLFPGLASSVGNPELFGLIRSGLICRNRIWNNLLDLTFQIELCTLFS
jgi:hypothetical protein